MRRLQRIFLVGRRSLWICLTDIRRFQRISLAGMRRLHRIFLAIHEEVVKNIPSWQKEFVDMPN
jgi:hypothetical protein